MRDIILTAFVLGTIPFILYRPYVGVLVWAWLSYMTPYRYTWSFAYDFRFAYIIAIVVLIGWLLTNEKKNISWKSPLILLILFWVWTSITTALAMFPNAAQYEWQDITKKILMDAVVTTALITNRQRITALVWIIALSIGFFGIKGGIFTLATGGHYRVQGAPDTYFGENNFLAAALIIVIPLMRYLQLSVHQRFVRWGITGVIGLCIISALGSYSRGAFLGLIALGLFMLARSRKKLLVSFGVMAAVSLGAMLMPDSWHERMATILTYEEDTSALGRLDAWDYALEVIDEHPLAGLGYEAFRGNESLSGTGYTAAHSIFFQLLGEHGIVGFGLYFLTGIFTFFLGNRVIRQARENKTLSWAQDLARMIQISLLVFCCVGAFLNITYFELLFHLIALMVVTATVVEREVVRAAPDPAISARMVGQEARSSPLPTRDIPAARDRIF